VLLPRIDPVAFAEIQRYELAGKYEEYPRDMALLMAHHYVVHVLRMPHAQGPDLVHRAFQHLNAVIYVPMQGPSELGASGKLLHWDRMAELTQIVVPCLVIGAQHDPMDPEHMAWMAAAVQHGRYLYCPKGSQLDQARFGIRTHHVSVSILIAWQA
jgi:proline iminopeptidase